MLQIGDLRCRTIAREHDLFMAIKQRVEGVEKLLLRALLATKKLDVIDQKEFRLTIALAEFDQVIVLNRIDELVDEQFAREIHHFGRFLFDPSVMPDGLHQMRLPKSHATVNKKRVVSA